MAASFFGPIFHCKELHSLAGNAYNVKAVGAAYTCALSVCDVTKFNNAVDERLRN